jgi:uncharacterized protein YukE
MANYSINPQAAQEAEDDMGSATTQLNSSLETLQDAVNRFTVANHGQAPDAYAGAQATWSQGQTEINQALALGQQRLQAIIANYVSGDNRGAAVFSG